MIQAIIPGASNRPKKGKNMTKMIYVVTTPNGKYEVTDLPAAREIVNREGGSWKIKYQYSKTY